MRDPSTSSIKKHRTLVRGRTLVRVMRLMGRRFWPYSIGLVTFALTIAVCFNIILAFLMKDVIDAAAQNDAALIRRAVVLALVTFLGGTPLLIGTRYLTAVCIKRTMTELRSRLFNHVTRLPMARLAGRHSGDLISRATNDLQRIEGIYFDQLNYVLVSVLMGVISIGAIFGLNGWLGLVALVAGLLTTAASVGFAKPLRQAATAVQEAAGTLTERLIDLLQGIAVTRAFGPASLVHERYSTANTALTTAQLGTGRVESYTEAINTALWWLKSIGFFGLGLVLYHHGVLPLGSVWALVALQAGADSLFSGLAGLITGVQQSLVAAARVFEVLDQATEPTVLGPGASEPSIATEAGHDGMDIVISGVAFSYAGSESEGDDPQGRTALHDLTLTVGRGQFAAVVGPSGAGKSTITRLLLGFYSPEVGEIAIGSRPLTSTPLHELRDMVAYVPQEAHLFAGTIEDNVRLGRPNATRDDVIAAAQAAGAHDFILAQPDGYATEIGEHGQKLSGGQRRRIAIARALLKDAPILLLDEATSSLDSASEAQVQDALNRLMEGRTTLAIAHRLSTVEHADVIYCMRDGTIVEQGTHTDRLARGGLYAELHALQLTWPLQVQRHHLDPRLPVATGRRERT